jgi:tryptophan synthase beta chain
VVHEGLVEATSYSQVECFTEAVRFAQAEGIIPAPEPSHAIRQVITEVERAKEEGVEKTILFNLCGHGHFDMAAYADFLSGNMQDLDVDEGELARASEALAALPGIA